MAQDPWAVVSTTPAPPPAPTPKQPAHDPWAVVDTKPVAAPKPSDISETMAVPNPKGMASPGNLSIWNRPKVQNADGTHSSEYSVSFNQDGKEVLVPTVVDGKFLTPDGKKPKEGSDAEKAMFKEAWRHYLKTGENLGKFHTPEDADAYASILHSRGDQPKSDAAAPDLGVHSDATVEAYKPTWTERIRKSVTNSQPFHALETYAPGVASALHLTPTDVSGTEQYYTHKGQLVGLENLAEGAFRKDPADKAGAGERIATGAAKAVSGLTSPDMLLLQAIPMGDLLGLGGGVAKMVLPRLVTAGFGASMAKGLVDQWKEREEAKAAGDDGTAHEIEGEMSVSAAMLLLMGHAATREISEAVQTHANAEALDQHAQEVYKADYKDLSDKQKATVIYNVAADADPLVKARVDQETKRLAKVAEKSGLPSIKEVGETDATRRQEYEQRAQAAKNLTQQVVARQRAAAQYRQDAQMREAETRRAQAAQQKEIDRAAAEAKSPEQQRGFPVEESRETQNLPATGLHKTTEREPGQRYEPEPAAPTIPVTDRRSAPGIVESTPQTLAAESRVNELAEGRMGQSFASLPLARQRVAARWMERFQPEAWAAFRETPAHQTFQDHVEMAGMADAALHHYLSRNGTGESEQLNPGADIHAGIARLILDRTDIGSALAADKDTHKDLNEHAEQSMGKSFDSLAPEDRVPALAEYLRDKPEKLKAFVTQDLTDRMRSGQHIDLANMESELIDRQQVHLLMEHRDQIQRDMERAVAGRLVAEQREARNKELSETMYQALTGHEATLEPVHAASHDLTRDATELGLGPVSNYDDLFRIEKTIRDTRPDLRTGKMQQFLTRMQQVRAAAEDHILQTIAKNTADLFRESPEEAREKAAKQVIDFVGKANDLQDAADNLRAEGSKAANEAEREANAEKAKADAVEAGAVTAQSAAPESQVRRDIPISIGRETRVVSPRNETGAPAHYAVVDMGELQTSHLPQTFEKRPGYDQNGQPRDYSTDKDAQTAVASRANNLDLDVLLGNGVTTMEGPAIMDQRGHVISGNGRTLSLLSADSGELGRYTQELHDRAASFGIDPAEVFKYKRPVLVKVLDAPVESGAKWALMGKDMNDSSSRGISETDLGLATANLLSPEYVDRLTKIVESLPSDVTIREAMRARSAEIAKLLTDVGAIAPNRLVEYVDKETGDLKEKAKDLFENMLSGLTVTDPAVLGRASASVKDKLTRAGLSYIRMRNAGENWNLASMNTDAVKLLTRAQDAAARLSSLLGKESGKGTGSGSLVERYLHPERYFDPTGRSVELSFDGQPLHAPVHAGVEALAMALEESPKAYANMMAKFADYAAGVQQTMWGAEHPADVFTNEIGAKYELSVVPEEWGAVVGLSDQVKAQIEETRGPLPVEPADHAKTALTEVMPDSSSVLDVIPEGPKSTRELQAALEAHPGFTQEQAEAVTQLFEDILPRAIGEDLNTLLANRKLSFVFGGKEAGNRGFREVLDSGAALIGLFDTAEPSTFVHEMAHFMRPYLNPGDQAIANGFVGAKPGEEWTSEQEEKFAQAFERYHFDGGIRRGKLEKVFQTIHRAMQSIYNAVTGRKLAKGSPELNQMFDNWYDWSRAERKPITARIDLDALVETANGKIEIPQGAKFIDSSEREITGNDQVFVFMDRDAATEFVKDKKNGVKAYRMYKLPGEDTVWVRAEAKQGKKLFQPSLNETIELARKAKDLEAQLKRATDPREQARLRGALNGIEDKMKGATGIIGTSEPRDTSVLQLVNGMGELPGREPTTPVQATTAQQIFGDPTSVELGGERGVKRAVSDAAVREESRRAEGVDEGRGKDDGQHAIAQPQTDPLAKVKAAKLAAPKVERGTPVVDPGKWREHVEALGLPDGTPPPTVRLAPDIRNLMIYPGQSEAVEGVLSALQQYDGTILASGAGTGKTHMLSAIAENLLGTGGDKVGLLITRSQNLIHEADGFVETARKYGVDVQAMPSKIKDMTTGMYAATYSGIRGNRDMLSIPWDFVLFDESGEAANWTESEQGKAVVLLGHAAKKAVYSSATPYSTVMELGYMHKLDLWPKGGFFEWAQQFGLHEVGPNTYAGGAAAKKLEKLRQQLIERGQWQQLYKDMSGTEAHVALVPQTPEVREGVRSIRAAFAMAKNAFIRAGMSKYITPTAGHEAIYLKRYISGARLKDAIELGKKAVAGGWTPVFFTEYRSPAEEGMEFFHNLPGDLGKTINKMLPPLPDVVGEMRKAFGNKVGIFAGEANEARATELEEFHTGQKDALYMTYAAGGVGANGQDKVGDSPRFGIFIDMPWGGKMLEQGTNRTWRYGSKSGVVNVFLTSDALPEMKLLATKVLPRMRALKAAVFGEKMESSLSRKLRDAAGIPEELLQYEHGEEVAPQAAEFEQDGEGAKYTPISDYDVPSAKKFQNKPMEYKGQGKRLYQGDRRQNSALRKRISEMSPEELRKTLLTSDVVDLPNGRAFDEAERTQPAAAVAMSDADGLKAFNDKFGYEAGNALLQAKAAALKAAGLEAYHEKGDEFLFRGQSPDELRTKLEQARDALRNVQFDVEADGKKMTLKGVDFSYGTGTDLHEAEDGLHEHKDEREAAGERQRGELGGIVEVQRDREHPRAERGIRLFQGPSDNLSLFREMGEKLKKARAEYSATKPETVEAYNEALRNYEFASPSFMKRYLREQMGQMKTAGDVVDVEELERMARVSKKLYQGPKDEDPFQKAANDAWEELMGRTAKLPAAEARMLAANEGVAKLAASEAGQRAMGTGHPVEEVVRRRLTDILNNEELENKALIEFYKKKKFARAIARFVQNTTWIGIQSGDKTVEKVFKRAGLAKDGEEMKRRIIDFDMRKGLYQGRMQAVVREIVNGNGLKPPDIELMSKVVENQATTDDPRITKAVKEWRQFTASVRKALADAGSVVVIYEDGKRKEIPYSAIDEDPHYWPRMYDWNKPFIVKDEKTGNKEVHTLAEIMNMPTSDERRAKVVDQFAKERGISILQARAFFERNNRGIRLAGNVERAREWNIPTYGRDRQAMERYIDEVSGTLAATEVHGQFRQKTDPLIAKLNPHDAGLVNHIVTSDLDPARLPETDRAALSTASAFIITGKMFYSPIKVSTHLWKVWMGTTTRSFFAGILRGATHPRELVERARDCNALLEYSKSIWMREYGMQPKGIAQKFLDFNGFTIQIQFSRVISSAVGRHFFESYVYPKLLKDPQNQYLRWKLKDQYGMSDGQIDDIIKNGYGPDDVRRMELGAANWTTGSNRASEMPAAFRSDRDAKEWQQHLTTLLRSTQMLHGFMFKTANFVNRAVFEQLAHANWKSTEPFYTVGRFAASAGLAGWALEQLMYLRHQLQGSTEAEIEKHRHEWLAAHPASAEALWWSMANMSMAVGVQPLADLFNELATRNPKDRQKLATQRRFTRGVMGMPLGIPGQDAEAISTAFEDMVNSYSDTGKHQQTPEERRANILKRLVQEEVVGANMVPSLKPTKVPPKGFSKKAHRKTSTLQ